MRKLLVFILFFLTFFAFTKNSYAEKIDSFDVYIVSHKDGSMNVTEIINYDFEGLERHGIFRDIPLYSKVGDLYRIIKIDDVQVERDGKSEKYKKSQNNEQITFKIGDGDKTITGTHIYKINYKVENGIGSNFPNHDEIYWNATGNDWIVPIGKSSITFSNDFRAVQNELICFTGEFGSQEKNCNTLVGSAVALGTLYPGEGLTAVATYPKGTFPPSFLSKNPPQSTGEKMINFIFRHIVIIYFILNVVLPVGLFLWYQKHKNKKRFGKPVVNFDIPKDPENARIPPAIVGTIDNAKLERDDVVATIFDLAIRKYIRLVESKTKRDLLPDSKKQKIIKLKEDDGKLNSFEKKLFDRLFKTGSEIEINELRKDFYKTYQDMEEEAFRQLVKNKYFVKNPKLQRGLLIFLGIFTLITTNFFLSGILFFLGIKLIGRTEAGDEIDYKIDGLKLFLKSMDRNYKWQAEKFYTVEQMIPYAMSLGFIDKFMEQLKIIKPDYNPTWYHGYSGSFYHAYPAFFTSMSSNMTTSAPSSSSGFSSGFSGGGGGGGGGGSW